MPPVSGVTKLFGKTRNLATYTLASSKALMTLFRGWAAHRTVSSVGVKELKAFTGQLDFLLVTAGASLEWDALIGTLVPKGRLHIFQHPPPHLRRC